jgi:probable HAF family extracellular repeat protein
MSAIATGINDQGQVVGSTWDSNFNWSHAFIWQDGVMTDLNTLFPASSNLFATMANKINERGQISGMAIVLSGPDAGNIHAFLATPAHQSMGKSVAEVARTHPKSSLPANAGEQAVFAEVPRPIRPMKGFFGASAPSSYTLRWRKAGDCAPRQTREGLLRWSRL